MGNIKNTTVNCNVEVQSLIENARLEFIMKEKEILLSKYTLPKEPCKDGYYRMYIPDKSKKNGRRQIASRDIGGLIDKIYCFEKGIAGKARKTFKDCISIVLEEKLSLSKGYKKLSKQGTVSKWKSEYKRFYSDTYFENLYMDEITRNDIHTILVKNLNQYDVTDKTFSSLTGFLRAAYKIACREGWVDRNLFADIDTSIYADMILEKQISNKDRAYSNDVVRQILDYLHDYQSKKPWYIPAYALELQIYMGCRRGELPPIKWTSVNEDGISIEAEQLTVKKTETEKEHFVIVPHTKNYKDRVFPRTKAIDDLLNRLKKVHDVYYANSEYLFPANSENGVITNNTVYDFYRRMLKKLGIKQEKGIIKGTHSFRRNAITDVVNSTNGNLILAAELFGNSPEVIRKNYFTGIDTKQAIDALEQRKWS